MYSLLVILSIFLLVSCDDQDQVPPIEGWSPSICANGSSSSCGVDWSISFKALNFPADVQIVINDVVVIDECDPKSNWSRNSYSDIVEFSIRDFANLDGTQTVNLAMYDMKECREAKVLKFIENGQNYEVANVGGQKKILIKRY